MRSLFFLLTIALSEAFAPVLHLRPFTALSAINPVPFLDTTPWLTASAADTSMLLSAATTEPWVQPLSIFLGIFFNGMSFAMLCRVVLSWYPTANVKEFPWIAIVLPTEPLLRAIKGAVPPAFGVDITPIVWLATFTFFNEILLGQQGLLTLKMKYGI